VTVAAASSTASQVYPGLVGFLVVAGMGLALYFLFRSLNKQLHKISPGAAASTQARPRARTGLAAHRAMRAQAAMRSKPGGPGSPDQPPDSTRP